MPRATKISTPNTIPMILGTDNGFTPGKRNQLMFKKFII